MLIPSIDLMGGRIVQLVQGEKLRLAFDDFEYWIERFSTLSARAAHRPRRRHAPGRQLARSSSKLQSACRARSAAASAPSSAHAGARCRGAARDHRLGALFAERARSNTEFAAELAAAIGAEQSSPASTPKNGRIAVKGWKAQVELTPDEAIPQLEPYVAAFLYTHVDGEGMMQGFPYRDRRATARLTATPADRRRRHSQPAGNRRARCDRRDAVAGMAVYTDLLAV